MDVRRTAFALALTPTLPPNPTPSPSPSPHPHAPTLARSAHAQVTGIGIERVQSRGRARTLAARYVNIVERGTRDMERLTTARVQELQLQQSLHRGGGDFMSLDE